MRKQKLKSKFILVLCLVTSLSGYAQMNQKIDISLKDKTLKEFFQAIESKTDYTFMYNNIDLNQKITVDAKQTSLDQLLTNVLTPRTLTFEVRNRQILIKQSPAQTSSNTGKKISGTVVDENGEPVIGANVSIKGTTNGTITDLDGHFTLDAAPGQTMQISYIGYTQREQVITSRSSYQISMTEDTRALDEVVVIGYGVVRKADLTGAVGSLKGESIAERKTTQLSQALQGAMPGVMVTRTNNAPGAGATIKIRGVTTIGNSDPLVIVDGVPVGGIDQVSPNDIESVNVLKDAASASIYGSRAAAGVILITTKRASELTLSLDYTYEYGVDMPTRKPSYVDAVRYMEMTNELRWNDNGNNANEYPLYPKTDVENYLSLNAQNPNKYPITDWTGLILRNSAPRQSHIVSLSGGSKTVRTKATVGYDDIEGLYHNRNYSRLTARINNDFKFNKFIGATVDANFKRTEVLEPTYGNIIYGMRCAAPVYAAMWSDGRIAEGKAGNNPYAALMEGGAKNTHYNQLMGKASIDLTPIDGLKISAIFSPTYNFDQTKTFNKQVAWYTADDPNQLGGYMQWNNTTKLTENRNESFRMTSQLLATYLKTFGNHNINIMTGYEDFYSKNESMWASRDKYLLDYPYLDLGPKELRDNGGNANEVAYRSIFGRAIYSFKNKYLLQANFRRDGSSRFHRDFRFANFPSFSAGWVLSEESFIKPQSDWLSFLKVRASWGSLGNERIGNYPYQSTIAFGNALFYQGSNVVSDMTAAQVKYAIQNISWETTESLDLGIDANFFNNRLRFTGDYFFKTTRDMLLALQIPMYIGFENPDKNTGKMNTRGYELDLSWSDQKGDWNYSISANLSDFVSKMGDLGGTEFLGDVIKKEGSEFNEWYGYRAAGIFQTKEEVELSPKLSTAVRPGDIKYLDISGPDGIPDGKITPDYDRVLLGGSMPRYMYGVNGRVGYKDFDFAMTFQGVGKRNVRIARRMIEPLPENWGAIPTLIDGNYFSNYNTPEQNQSAEYPRLTQNNKGNNYAMSDYWLFNGSYLRLKNITFGYTLPDVLTQKAKIKRLRFYVSANDLFCISKYPNGWDPEVDGDSYPITTSVLFGASINF